MDIRSCSLLTRTTHLIVVQAVIALAVGGSASAAPAPAPELFLAPSQNLDTFRKAWSVKLKIDCRAKSFEDIVADLAKRSGIPIRLDIEKGYKTPPDRALALICGGPLYGERSCQMVRARHFLGDKWAEQLSNARCWAEKDLKTGQVQFRCSSPAPLACALTWLADHMELDVSYRKNGIVLGTYKALAPELCITRAFQVKEGRGMVWSVVNGNTGKTRRYQLDLLDKVGLFLALSGGGGWRWPSAQDELTSVPTCAYERLRRIDPMVEASFDAKRKVLTVGAHPVMLQAFKCYYLEDIDKVVESSVVVIRNRGR